MGWYAPREGNAVYTEIPLATMTMKDYPGASLRPSEWKSAFTLAMANNGLTSVCAEEGSPEVRTNYVLDRSSSKWVPINVPPMGGSKFAPVLIGSNQDDLIFKYGQESGFFSVSQ